MLFAHGGDGIGGALDVGERCVDFLIELVTVGRPSLGVGFVVGWFACGGFESEGTGGGVLGTDSTESCGRGEVKGRCVDFLPTSGAFGGVLFDVDVVGCTCLGRF